LAGLDPSAPQPPIELGLVVLETTISALEQSLPEKTKSYTIPPVLFVAEFQLETAPLTAFQMFGLVVPGVAGAVVLVALAA
jgi:hypothetical protein